MTRTKEHRQAQRLILSRRLELWLTPLLIVAPFIIAVVFLVEWFTQGYLTGSSLHDGELLLGIIIIILTASFDIPFIRTIRIRKEARLTEPSRGVHGGQDAEACDQREQVQHDDNETELLEHRDIHRERREQRHHGRR
jgi:hypothetical protein